MTKSSKNDLAEDSDSHQNGNNLGERFSAVWRYK